MEFNGTFEIEDVSPEEVWLALSDPIMIKSALPGCEFLVEVEGDDVDFGALKTEAEEAGEDPPILPEADPDDVAARAFEEGGRYAALVEIGVGSVKPSFETIVTIEEREFPDMTASGEGSSSGSSFEMTSGMTLEETESGVSINWWAETDVFGRIAQMGQRVINPVANRVINRFFGKIEDQLNEVSTENSSIRDKIRNLV